jgi:hypothetical protein
MDSGPLFRLNMETSNFQSVVLFKVQMMHKVKKLGERE